MRIGSYEAKLRRRLSLAGWKASLIPILAILFALALFSSVFILAGVKPLLAYRQIFSYAFANPNGFPLTLYRFIFLLLCTFAFIIPFRAGLWNIGMTGQLYGGVLAAFAVPLAFGVKTSPTEHFSAAILIPLMGARLVIVSAHSLWGMAGISTSISSMIKVDILTSQRMIM